MKKLVVLALVSAVTVYSAVLIGASGEEAVEKFKSRFYSIGSMKGVITLSYSSGETLTGAFRYMAPGKFSIKFSAPAGKEVVTNGKRLWIFDKNNNICGVQDVGGSSGGIAGFINGYMSIASNSGSDTMIRLKGSNKFYRDVTIVVDSSYMIKKAVFRNEKGDGFTATLSGLVLNEPMPVGSFDFNVPSGVQLVKNPLDVR